MGRKRFTLARDDGRRARWLEERLVGSLPAQWAPGLRGIKNARVESTFDHLFRRKDWLDRLKQFEVLHGDALRWSMADSDVCELAVVLARLVTDYVTIWPEPLSLRERLDVVVMACRSIGVDVPSSITAAGAVERCMSPDWWRRALRRKVARIVEHGAIKLGIVCRGRGAYCSDHAVVRRADQLRRNDEYLSRVVMRNEAGQSFTLATLASSSVSNRQVRGGELMTRIRGCEEYASSHGHVGTFWALTTPSRFHPVLSGSGGLKGVSRRNPRYDGFSTPRDAQTWLCENWARARAEMAREGIGCYGFRVAEPHHDSTPHWHAMLWFKNGLEMAQGMSIIAARWFSDAGRESGAHDHRVNVKVFESGGAAAYMAKYIAKSIGHVDVGAHLDTLDGLEAAVCAGDVPGWQRVDAWAATWGIRQFQAIGQPSVTVWREMRRVTVDQVQHVAQIMGNGVPQKIWYACHRHGVDREVVDVGGVARKVSAVPADWARFMRLMGGAAVPRSDYVIRLAKRVNQAVNAFGEDYVQKKVVGLVLDCGHWLVSRRQVWSRVFGVPESDPASSAAQAAAWSGFNNCTARLTGRLRAALLGLDKVDLHGASP